MVKRRRRDQARNVVTELLQPTMSELAGKNDYSEMVATRETEIGGNDPTYELPGHDNAIKAPVAQTPRTS